MSSGNLQDPGQRNTLGSTKGRTLAAFKPLAIPAKLGVIGKNGRFGAQPLDVSYSALEPEEAIAPEPVLAQQSPDAPQVAVQGNDSPGGGVGDGGTGSGAGAGDSGGTGGSSGDAGAGSSAGDAPGDAGGGVSGAF